MENHSIRYTGIFEDQRLLEYTTSVQKCTIRRLSNLLFLSGEILYRRTLNSRLLRCIKAIEACRFIEEVHVCTVPT